ncbi:MAG TPA: sigma-70 family RNA polymerase sigma factor, partial [Microthrixaceae bacterium]|nr:sigma-70 family RNA polymerase sigma factor [Microthrixaceae bacterium]
MNRVRDHVRRVKRRGAAGDEATLSAIASKERGESESDRSQELNLLRRALESLNDQDREIVELRHHGGLSFKQISDMLDEYSSMEIADIDLARFMDQMMTICSRNHIEMPPGVTMLVRGIVTIEGVILDIAPEVSPIQVFIAYVTQEEFEDFDIKVTAKKLLRESLAAGNAGLEIPVSLQELLSVALKGQTKLN